ncbi:hypothetical protein GWK36_02655 [Caldichromatium japonicum]|uniref:CNP1-like uncharacterized domain-containing protein n=1 Tax=Caldichromatium japonicum TaxID=2699430 RepID=A0A6G7VAI4_9GAMM|nr:CNP1-like family protein [Caldichromatium japonicum]QIK37083.1 hypothetical protein GWK36_02655 [Caldichromatium japonicum]
MPIHLSKIRAGIWGGWLTSTVLATALNAAEQSPFIHEPEPPVPASVNTPLPWSEDPSWLPPLPQEADLLPLNVASGSGVFRYFIDGRNLVIGQDGVVRYTILIRSPSGTPNLSFEGIRCTARGQYRVFAYGTDQGFTPVDQDWQPIGLDSEPYRIQLWRHHLCLLDVYRPRSVAEIKRSLQIQGGAGGGQGLLSD